MTDQVVPTAAFSASDAALDGFRVIRTHWRLMIGWALFNIIALVVLSVAIAVVSVMLYASGASKEAVLSATVVAGFLGWLTIEVMIVTALYRAEMRSGEPGFLHLRLGADELRMLLVWLLLLIGAFVWVGGSTWITARVQDYLNTPLAFVAGVVCLGGLSYLLIRLSLAPPMTFDTRRLSFTGSWRMTRGRALPLLGTTAIAIGLLAMMAVLGWFVLYLAVGALSGFREMGLPSMDNKDTLTQRPIAWLIQFVGEIVYFPLFLALIVTPQVTAYRHFRAGRG